MASNLANAGRKLAQSIKNYVWGINDTMNMPAVWVAKMWQYVTPEWSKVNRAFQSLEDTARYTSDMWQKRNAPGYIIGRMSPSAAVFWAAPASWTLWLAPFLWVETAWLSTLSSPLDFQDAWGYEQTKQQQLNNARKQQIAESLIKWKTMWVNFNDKQIKPLIQKIISEYNSL